MYSCPLFSGKIIEIYEVTRLRASPRHGGAKILQRICYRSSAGSPFGGGGHPLHQLGVVSSDFRDTFISVSFLLFFKKIIEIY